MIKFHTPAYNADGYLGLKQFLFKKSIEFDMKKRMIQPQNFQL